MQSLILLASILCFSLINAQCAQIAGQIATVYPPTLDTTTSTFVNNILTAGFKWGTTTTRAIVPTAFFGSCSVPVVNNGVDPVDNCQYNQLVSYDFAQLTSTCGWTNLSSGSVETYGGSLTLIGLETYIDSRNVLQTRNLTYTMQISVTFPAFATSNTTVEIFSAVLLDVLVSSQLYTRASNKATITFSTVVGYPFKVSLINAAGVVASGTTPSSGFGMTVAANAGTATFGTTQGSQSTQPWDLFITPAGGACYFSGSYNLSAVFRIECALSNVSDCPPINDNIVNVALSILSESFCFQIASYVSVTATLGSFSDAGLTLPATNFLVEDAQTSYFKMEVTSTSVSIATIDIQTIFLQASSTFLNASGSLVSNLNLYSSNTWQNANVAGALSTATANGGIQSFSFSVNEFLFAIPLDTSASIVVQVNATLSYVGGRKRDVVAQLAMSTQNQQLSTVLQVTSSNDGFKTQFSFALFAALFLFFYF